MTSQEPSETIDSADESSEDSSAMTPQEPPVVESAPVPAEEPIVESAPVPAPIPAPRPAPVPSPVPMPAAPAAPRTDALPAAPAADWGRVDDDGTVFVRTADGERSVGQYAAGSSDEALAFFTRRFDSIAAEVGLLESRVNAAVASPEEASESVRAVRAQVTDANAVGDLTSLAVRLDALGPVIAAQRQVKRDERAQKTAEAAEQKEALISEAERLAEGSDWRGGANRLRDLLETWKALPRLDRPTDDALWKRFSTARTTYTRRRKSHFSEQNEKRDGARIVKERLAKVAEGLATSTDWGPTAGKYRDLMRDWKVAGPAPKDVDEALWTRFRGAQDAFFGARDGANAALDAEFVANAEVKDKLIVQAEALVPALQSSGDLAAAKRAFRDLADKWEEAGKVPRDRIKELDGRIRKVEQAIRSAEDNQWKSSDPEKSARADDMVSKLESAIAKVEADLEKARTAGDARKVRDLEDNLASRQSFLEMARKASADFSG